MFELDPYALVAQGAQHGIDTLLVDYTHTFAGYAQLDETLLRLYPKTMSMKVGRKTTSRFPVGVRNIVSSNRPFAGHHAYPGHEITSFLEFCRSVPD